MWRLLWRPLARLRQTNLEVCPGLGRLQHDLETKERDMVESTWLHWQPSSFVVQRGRDVNKLLHSGRPVMCVSPKLLSRMLWLLLDWQIHWDDIRRVACHDGRPSARHDLSEDCCGAKPPDLVITWIPRVGLNSYNFFLLNETAKETYSIIAINTI